MLRRAGRRAKGFPMRRMAPALFVLLAGCGAASDNGTAQPDEGQTSLTGGGSQANIDNGADSGVAAGGHSGTSGAGGSPSAAGTSANGGSMNLGGGKETGGSSGGGAVGGGGAPGGGGSAGSGGAANTGGSPIPVDGGASGTWVDISPFGLEAALGLAVAPSAPGTVYVNAKTGWPPSDPKSGIFKSTDGGNSWGAGAVGTKFFNSDGSDAGANPWRTGVSWTLAVDPTNADIVYAHCSFFGPQGLWKTTDGGTTWRSMFSSTDNSQMTADVYAIAIDRRDPKHLLVTFHSGWAFKSDAGVAESKDGGTTWIEHPPRAGWGAGHYAFFLGQDDAGMASSQAWILATQGNGYWRTMDAGATWTQVTSSYNMQHGAGGMYRASTGVLYMGAVGHLLRSTDNGKSWSDAGAPSNSDGYNTVIGDGVRMYVQSANTGTNTTGPQTFYSSLETDGTHWTPYNSQRFPDGPGWMAYDAANRLIYASLWDHGLWRLKAGN